MAEGGSGWFSTKSSATNMNKRYKQPVGERDGLGVDVVMVFSWVDASYCNHIMTTEPVSLSMGDKLVSISDKCDNLLLATKLIFYHSL
jgi:hypothetical protein